MTEAQQFAPNRATHRWSGYPGPFCWCCLQSDNEFEICMADHDWGCQLPGCDTSKPCPCEHQGGDPCSCKCGSTMCGTKV